MDLPCASVCAALGALLMGKTMKIQNFILAVMEDQMDSLLWVVKLGIKINLLFLSAT